LKHLQIVAAKAGDLDIVVVDEGELFVQRHTKASVFT